MPAGVRQPSHLSRARPAAPANLYSISRRSGKPHFRQLSLSWSMNSVEAIRYHF
ncbi:hypothetical protein CSC17_0528 [Klebsiella oxytoca]|nr:hypothetical protein CSC17_0528 [Klebsiella oxytoca]EUC86233.1 hypothetical protein HMPREF1570_3008 [Klebsiella oxytoca KA-2]